MTASSQSQNIPAHRSRQFLTSLLIFVSVTLMNLLVCGYWLRDFSFLNDDSALLNGAVFGVPESGLLKPFFSPHGPNVIRPFQVLGMYFEGNLFGFNALPMHCVSLVWLILAEGILIAALVPWSGLVGALVTATFVAWSMGAAEPRYWLSDRHDLYLFFFFAVALWLATRLTKAVLLRQKLVLILLGVFAQWGCFWSNEKGTVVPAIVSGLLVLTLFDERVRRKSRTPVVIYAIVAALNISFYLGYRYLIIGKAIGGYTDSLLPTSGIGLRELGLLFATVATTPFRHETENRTIVASLLGWTLVLGLLFQICGSRLKKALFLCFFAIGVFFLSFLPTLLFSFNGVVHGSLNSRMQWLPLIVFAILIGILAGHGVKYSLTKSRRTWSFAAAILLCCSQLPGGARAAKNFSRAGEFSDTATDLLQSYCSCVTFDGRRFRGLPPTYAGYHTFTETTWVELNAKIKGTPGCSLTAPNEEICGLVYVETASGLDAIPHQISRSKVEQKIENLQWKAPPDSSATTSRKCQCTVDSFLVPTTTVTGEPGFQLHGWCVGDQNRPAEAIILASGNDIIAATQPNRDRPDVIKALGLHATARYGFHLIVASSLAVERTRLYAIFQSAVGKELSTCDISPGSP